MNNLTLKSTSIVSQINREQSVPEKTALTIITTTNHETREPSKSKNCIDAMFTELLEKEAEAESFKAKEHSGIIPNSPLVDSAGRVGGRLELSSPVLLKSDINSDENLGLFKSNSVS